MGDDEDERVAPLVEPHERESQRAVGRQVERPAAGRAGEVQQRGLAVGRRDVAEVGDRPRGRQAVEDDLLGLAARAAAVDRAQDLVTRDDRREARVQQRGVERTGDPQQQADVVGGARRVDLMDEPHPLLGVRKPRGTGRAGRDPRLPADEIALGEAAGEERPAAVGGGNRSRH